MISTQQKSWWDSSQFKLLNIDRLVCIINYTDKLKVNQIKYIINHWWYIVQQP